MVNLRRAATFSGDAQNQPVYSKRPLGSNYQTIVNPKNLTATLTADRPELVVAEIREHST